MIHSEKFTAVLDTNVLYPLWIRDILLWFAYFELYTPKWTQRIFDEMKIVFTQKGVNERDIEIRISKIKEAFPFAMVENFESFIEVIDLPDTNDKHVLAAAIKAKADVIVTHNTKDFPRYYLKIFDLEAKTPDDFLTDLIDLNHQLALAAFREMVLAKSNPKYDSFEILNIFRKVGLKNTADYLHSLL